MTNMIGLAGDWHGSFQWTRAALRTLGDQGVKTIFHAGDFSLGWPGKWPDLINIAEKVCKQYDMKLLITPGNHENWEWINTREFNEAGLHWMTDHTAIIRRNTTIDLPYVTDEGQGWYRRVLSLGGAPSIDFSYRVPGISWWPEEMITLQEAEEAAAMEDIDIMVCHDAPDGGTYRVQSIIDTPWSQSMWSRDGLKYAKEGRELMNIAYYGAMPKVFAHGHFHEPDMRQTEDTLFISLGCNQPPNNPAAVMRANNLALLDLNTLEAKFYQVNGEYLER